MEKLFLNAQEIADAYGGSKQKAYQIIRQANENLQKKGFLAQQVPMSEEVIFRGLIYKRLKRELNVYAAAFLSSLLFGVIHGMLFWAAYTFIAGLILVWVFEKYKSLAASILCHMIFNGIGFFHWLCF